MGREAALPSDNNNCIFMQALFIDHLVGGMSVWAGKPPGGGAIIVVRSAVSAPFIHHMVDAPFRPFPNLAFRATRRPDGAICSLFPP